ncbi:GntR family transcriptional regulator [Arthrobacter jiangjiafuii]|uniref:GntR family transcriptional regulator n=1 Tax=Arthrobacter jiangjiafuii TaxID=2817475 RepID=A0A975M2C9_9MICC|nr:GntR family transcriptional regulator [Arthrobacter jiangjiafuii]MBP3043112.1 GntR family transcriptional regulator [Arthrobacter jiangjiafuii]QWC08671.1 GntR family transcriptional regulator [Arthrobacter jiangjiafuii]
MLIRLAPHSSSALHEQVARALRTAIVNGDVRNGERLPSARTLAESLGINFHTVLRAYQDLRDEGLIELRRGRGAVVTGLPEPARDAAAEILDEAAARLGALGVAPEVILSMLRQRLQPEGTP